MRAHTLGSERGERIKVLEALEALEALESLGSLENLENLENSQRVKSEAIEEILCVTRRQIRSIVSLCEEFGVRSKVQNLPIGTIFSTTSNEITKTKKYKEYGIQF